MTDRSSRVAAAVHAWRTRPARWGRYTDPAALARDHFRLRSTPDHVNADSLSTLVQMMAGRPLTIVETGMSAWGTDSTRLFDSYVRSFGGEFWSVDIRPEPIERLSPEVGPRTHLVCQDSVAFLRSWATQNPERRADVVYLDSWDVDFADPDPAAEHCLEEVKAVETALSPGSLLLIDDSPGSLQDTPEEHRVAAAAIHAQRGLWPGKGMLADGYLRERGATVIHHRYQALYRI